MNVFLVQPPDTPAPLTPLDSAQGAFELFSPPWDIMCLQAFLQKHTRHICRFIDGRLLSDLEAELVEQINQLSPPRILVVNSPILALGQVAAILEISKRHFPSMRTVLCGEYPSSFPEHVADIPRADYALAGDPEPILRNLLDYIDLEPRLRRTPGLIMEDSVKTAPYWLNRLPGLALPDWNDIFWSEYGDGFRNRLRRAEMRVTRGHSQSPADRAHGGAKAPLRQWPLDRMATELSRCSHTEIQEVVLTDPPGFWTSERLAEWTRNLLHVRNLQPWSLSILPMELDADLIADLRESHCRRLDVIFPSCDRTVLASYGVKADWRRIGRTLQAVATSGIRVYPRYWIGSPEEKRDPEANHIVDTIRRLNLCDFRVEPFPFVIDSPLYEEHEDEDGTLALDQWIRWAREPWTMERPVPLWGGREAVAALDAELKGIHSSLQRSPALMWARLRAQLRSRNWIEALEDKAIAFLQRHRRPFHP